MKNLLVFVLLITGILIFTSCSPKATQPTAPASIAPQTTTPLVSTTSPVTSSSPTTAPKFAKRTWQFANYMASNFESWLGAGLVFSQELGKLSGGAITIVDNQGGSLLSGNDMPSGVAKGIADLGYMNPRAFPAQFPTRKIGGMADPLISEKHDIEYWSYLNSVLFYEFSYDEHVKNGLLPIVGVGSCEYNLFTTRKVASLNDTKGMRLRTSGGSYEARFYEAMGAVGVPVAFSEYVDAVGKGIVDGCMSVTATFHEAKMLDNSPYFLTLPGRNYLTSFFGGSITAMSNNLFKSLDTVEKRAVLQAARVAEENRIKGWEPLTKKAYAELRADPKFVFTELPMSEVNKLMSHPKVANQWDDLAKEIDADTKSDTGTRMVKRFFELADMSDAQLRTLWEQTWEKRIAGLW